MIVFERGLGGLFNPLRHNSVTSRSVQPESTLSAGCRVLTSKTQLSWLRVAAAWGFFPVGASHLHHVCLLLSFALKPMELCANNSLLPKPIKN